MKTIVVDASVAARWFLPEEGSAQANQLLSAEYRLIAPDLLWIEVAAVAWKAARRGGLSAAEAEQIARDTANFPVEIVESLPLLARAIQLALETDRTAYECLYLALAVRQRAVVVTADDRLVNALSKSAWAKRVNRLAEIA